MLTILLTISEAAMAATPAEAAPITVTINESKTFATFTNPLHPGNRIGYRFHEHTPMTCGDPPASAAAARIDPNAGVESESLFAARPGVITHSVAIGDADWAPQRWTFYLAPVPGGIDLLWVVETFDAGLNRYYGVQQCFRLGGDTNEAWRREIADTPAFSEYDLWNTTQKDTPTKTSLTYVLRNGAWAALPAARDTVGARTPLGLAVDTERTAGRLDSMPEVGPYHARMLDPIDNGLITRIDHGHEWVCAIYWQQTSHVSDHHPADCLHSIVNIGNVPPHARRALRGKIYWFKGSLNDLAQRWKHDFPNE